MNVRNKIHALPKMEFVSATFGVEARTFAVMFANVVAGRASFPRFSRKRRRNYVF